MCGGGRSASPAMQNKYSIVVSRKGDSCCGTCCTTCSGAVGVIEALVIAGVLGTIKKVGGGAGEGATTAW